MLQFKTLTCCSVRHPERSIAYDLMRHWQPFYKNFLTDMGAYVMSAQVRIGLGTLFMYSVQIVDFRPEYAPISS